jgi:hypothetical protein
MESKRMGRTGHVAGIGTIILWIFQSENLKQNILREAYEIGGGREETSLHSVAHNSKKAYGRREE